MTPASTGEGEAASRSGRAMRLGFAGTPEFAERILAALIGSRHAVGVVFTQPDRPAGRRRRLMPSPVRVHAEAQGLCVQAPERFHAQERWLSGLDVLVVAAYGLILPPAALAAPTRGCLNVHASLLPRWRGAAPVERAIMAGDAVTGVSIMQMEAGLDTGPVLLRREVGIDVADTGATLTARLAEAGAAALLECLDRLDDLNAAPQDDARATYAPKLTAADAIIDWSRPAIDIERQVRALAGRQPACTRLRGLAGRGESSNKNGAQGPDNEPVRMNVLAASAIPANAQPGELVKHGRGFAVGCGAGALALETVQLARGKGRPMAAASAANGYPDLFKHGARCDVGA